MKAGASPTSASATRRGSSSASSTASAASPIRDGGPVRLSRATTSRSTAATPSSPRRSARSAEALRLDGEVVAFERGRTSFARLAQRGQRRVHVFLYVFDILWLDGCDVRPLPLLARKRLCAPS
jgi:bifunctional non-homologous end joining protein LigD